MKDYKGLVGGITGAANGIGKGFALYVASLGMKLALIDIEGDTLEKVKKECEDAGAEKVITIQCDVSDSAQVKQSVKTILDEYGHIDLFYSNAGVASGGTIGNIPTNEWDWIMSVNALGMAYYATELLPIFTKQGTPADLIFTSSIGGAVPGYSFQSPYTASKHAAMAIAESCRDYADKNAPFIHVTCFCPEYINTTIWRGPDRRPERFQDNDNPFYQSDDYLDYIDNFRKRLEGGFNPRFVGPRLLQALDEGQIFVFPHMHTHATVLARMEKIKKCMERDKELDEKYKALEGYDEI